MFDREFLQSVCDLTVNFGKLRREYPNQMLIEYDPNDAFSKYYNVGSVIEAIEKYQRREITDREMAHWMCIYAWIINGGFPDGEITFDGKVFVQGEISYLIDGLSFFAKDHDCANCEDGVYDLEKSKEILRALDLLYTTIEDWAFYYARTDYCTDDDDHVILVVNEQTRQYIKLYSDADYLDEIQGFIKFNEKEFCDLLGKLEKDRYTMIASTLYCEDESETMRP